MPSPRTLADDSAHMFSLVRRRMKIFQRPVSCKFFRVLLIDAPSASDRSGARREPFWNGRSRAGRPPVPRRLDPPGAPMCSAGHRDGFCRTRWQRGMCDRKITPDFVHSTTPNESSKSAEFQNCFFGPLALIRVLCVQQAGCAGFFAFFKMQMQKVIRRRGRK